MNNCFKELAHRLNRAGIQTAPPEKDRLPIFDDIDSQKSGTDARLTEKCIDDSATDRYEYGQNYEDRNDTGNDGGYLFEMRAYLQERGLSCDDFLIRTVLERERGRHFTLPEHIKGLVYALLSNQTKWNRIEPHLKEIDELFQNYDPSFIKSMAGGYFAEGLFHLKCGNRRTKAQMDALARNVEIMERMQAEYGSMDAFVTSAPAYLIVEQLSAPSSINKLKMVGEALAWEYLRNVGIDGAKPDTHLRRFLGNARMGNSKGEIATPEEALHQVEGLAAATGLRLVEIDYLIWNYCADGYGEVCTATPHCEACVIQKYCNSRRFK